MRKIFAFIISLFLFASVFVGGRQAIAFAEEEKSVYTNVLEDLQKDEAFNVANYPANEKDTSIQVIQIAESGNNELFIYTYQPRQSLVATSVNMSLTEAADNMRLYDLTLLNSDGVFFKYKVNDIAVRDNLVRYYNIASIFRPWQEGIDSKPNNDNTIDEVSFNVSQLWTIVGHGSEISYYCTKTETITITDKYVDFLRYSNGWKFEFTRDACDSHYVAFSSDIDIDYLYDATISYTAQKYMASTPIPADKDGIYSKTIHLKDIDEASNKADGWGAEKHTWNRIERVEDFKKNETLSAEAKSALVGKQWVLRFAETTYTTTPQGVGLTHISISAVTILQLHFKSNGTIYNLGVVDNKQSGDNKPGNEVKSGCNGVIDWFLSIWNKLATWGKWLVMGLIVVFIVIPILRLAFGKK